MSILDMTQNSSLIMTPQILELVITFLLQSKLEMLVPVNVLTMGQVELLNNLLYKKQYKK